MKRSLTCICCPLGCNISVEFDGGKILNISGYTCRRGMEYAKNECTSPVRCVTSTVKTASGVPVPVKTDKPIPKDKIFECMKIINKITLNTPVKTGDIIARDVFGSNIIATSNS